MSDEELTAMSLRDSGIEIVDRSKPTMKSRLISGISSLSRSSERATKEYMRKRKLPENVAKRRENRAKLKRGVQSFFKSDKQRTSYPKRRKMMGSNIDLSISGNKKKRRWF